MAEKKVLVLVAEGSEDLEFASPVDVFTRCGANVTVAAVVPGEFSGAWGNRFAVQTSVQDVADQDFDAVLIPGGNVGAENLANDRTVCRIIQRQLDSGRIVAAICAAPLVVLGQALQVVVGRKVTGFPGSLDELKSLGAEVEDVSVLVDGNLITGRGPAAALEWSLAVADALGYADKTRQLRETWRL